MTQVNVYIAGPMRGIKDFNFPAFFATEGDIISAMNWTFAGSEVFNPARRDVSEHGEGVNKSETGDLDDIANSGFDLRTALATDLDFIARKASVVVVLDGWEASKGARAECSTAHALGIPVVSVGHIEQWIEGNIDLNPLLHPDEFAIDVPAAINYYDNKQQLSKMVAACEPTALESTEPHWADAASNILHAEAERWDALTEATVDSAPLMDNEVRSVSSTGGEKGVKLARFDLIPAGPLWTIAEVYGKGAQKYADRNWERGYEWSKSYGAMQRHLNQWYRGEDNDDHHPECPEGCVQHTGMPHLALAAWHCLALLEYANTHPEFDDRVKSTES